MTAPVTRYTIATPVPSTTRTGGYDMAYTEVVLASDCERLEQEFERLREQVEAMREALRIFIGCAYPVAEAINKRGHNWCDAYLDEALESARAALQAKPDHIPEPRDMVSQPPGNCRQRLVRDGLPHPRSGCDACGKFSPMWRDCDQALQAKP